MNTPIRIFWNDFKQLLRNPLALVVALALVVLSSAYAWWSVAVTWEPYNQADNLKIAVVNEDAGMAIGDIKGIRLSTRLDGSTQLDVGSMIVNVMQGDHSFDWQFVDAEQGKAGLESGEYYAQFVIPSNFTEDFLSVFSGSPLNPKIEYWVNEKRNGVALEVADAGAGVIDTVITRVLSTVIANSMTEIVTEVTNSLVGSTSTAQSQLQIGLNGAVRDVQSVSNGLDRAQEYVKQWREAVADAKESLEALQNDAPSLRNSIASATEQLEDARKAAHEAESAYASAFAEGGTELSTALSSIASNITKLAKDISSKQSAVETATEKVEKTLQSCEQLVATLRKTDPGSQEIAELEGQVEKLKGDLEKLEEANVAAGKASTDVADAANKALEDVTESTKTMKGRGDTFNNQILPQLDTSLDTLALSMGELDGALVGIDAQATQAKTLLDQLDSVLERTTQAIESSAELLDQTNESLDAARSDLSSLAGSQTVKQLTELVNVDVMSYGSYMASPVDNQLTAMYPFNSYGASAVPFYANVAIWIACLMLVMVMKLDVDPGAFPYLRPWQGRLGRLMLLWALALVQGVVVTVGFIVMGVHPVGAVSFVAAGAVIALSVMSIVYALATAFSHIGKALAVFAFVVQVPSALGMYPKQLMPELLQGLNQWLPLTYGMDAMREALGGFYGTTYLHCLLWLLVCGAGSLALALVLRPALHSLNSLSARALGKADIYQAGEGDLAIDDMRAQDHDPVISAMLSSDEGRTQLRERLSELNGRYSIARQAAPISVAVLLVVLGVIAVLLGLGVQGKLVVLMLFAIAVLIVFCACMAFERTRDMFERAVGDRLTVDSRAQVNWQPIEPYEGEYEEDYDEDGGDWRDGESDDGYDDDELNSQGSFYWEDDQPDGWLDDGEKGGEEGHEEGDSPRDLDDDQASGEGAADA